MTQERLRKKLRETLTERKLTQRKASAEIGIGYMTLMNFLGGANVEARTLFFIQAWIEGGKK